MSLVDRAKNICLTPNTEWPVIAAEPTSAGTLVTGYVVPLAAIGAVAGFIGGSIVGTRCRSSAPTGSLSSPDLLPPCSSSAWRSSGSLSCRSSSTRWRRRSAVEQNSTQALKVAVYSYTPAWIAGVLQIVPLLGIFAIFAALYGMYLLYLGLPRLMKCPEDKAVGYTAVVVVCAIVLAVVLTGIGGMIAGAGMLGAARWARGAGTGALGRASSSEVQFDKNSAHGQAAGPGQQARREQQEDGSRAEERRREGAGCRGLRGSRDAARRRQTRRSCRDRSAQGIRAGEVCRALEDGQQRREDGDCRAHGVEGRGAGTETARARA